MHSDPGYRKKYSGSRIWRVEKGARSRIRIRNTDENTKYICKGGGKVCLYYISKSGPVSVCLVDSSDCE
jgi:hypothetical protein